MIMDLAACYHLKPCELRPEQLMLDPANPRLSLAMESKKGYSSQEICSEKLQAFVENKVLDGHHQVARLVRSIRDKGFIRGSQPIIVKKVQKEKYLVLEGNRRTAAIRRLLREKKTLSSAVARSLETIPVQVFTYTKNTRHSEAEVLDILLGTIHIESPEEWGAMEKAFYVYRAYMREAEREYNSSRFHCDSALAKNMGERFSMTAAAVKLEIGIYRVYEQLKKKGYDIKPEGYTLIQLALKSSVSKEYFEYSSDILKMSVDGLDAYAQACVEEGASITNPKKWRAFAYVLKEGTAHEQWQVIEGKDPEQIKEKIEKRREKQFFRDSLQAIKQDIEKLKFVDFGGTTDEVNLVREIASLCNTFLMPLAIKKQNASSNGANHRPTTASDVLGMSKKTLRQQIEKLYDEKKDGISANRVPSILLREWCVRLENKDRRIFVIRVNEVMFKLEAEGFFD